MTHQKKFRPPAFRSLLVGIVIVLAALASLFQGSEITMSDTPIPQLSHSRNALQPIHGSGVIDAFILKIGEVTAISVSPTTIAPGGSVTATWVDIPNPSANDWIGLYATYKSDNFDYLSYRYTNGQPFGNLPFTVPGDTPAETYYELRLFSNNSFTRLATSDSFTVLEPTKRREQSSRLPRDLRCLPMSNRTDIQMGRQAAISPSFFKKGRRRKAQGASPGNNKYTNKGSPETAKQLLPPLKKGCLGPIDWPASPFQGFRPANWI